MTSGQFFITAFALSGTALLAIFIRRYRLGYGLMTLALLAGTGALAMRVYHAWPMLPMYLGLPGLVSGLTFIWLAQGYGIRDGARLNEGMLLLTVILGLDLLLLLFPKDFYMPFIRSVTIWSHISLWTAVAAKAMLLMASVRASAYLLAANPDKAARPLATSMGWALWGFVLLTLSMFSGEVWSYLGWGTPVVWHDPAITTVMALWFYWVCLLHLHYTSSWKNKSRAWFMVGGGLLLIGLGCHPDLGPLRLPFGL